MKELLVAMTLTELFDESLQSSSDGVGLGVASHTHTWLSLQKRLAIHQPFLTMQASISQPCLSTNRGRRKEVHLLLYSCHYSHQPVCYHAVTVSQT